MKKYLWFAFRLLFVASFALVSLNQVATPAPSPLPAPMLLFVLVGSAAQTRFLLFRSYKHMGTAVVWLAPSWFLNPFLANQPFQYFHMLAMSFCGAGLAGMAGGDSRMMFALCFGLGIWAGIGWSVLSHRRLFSVRTTDGKLKHYA